MGQYTSNISNTDTDINVNPTSSAEASETAQTKIDIKKQLIKAVMEANEERISSLTLENKMLSESLEKYKRMYHDLSKNIDKMLDLDHNSLPELDETDLESDHSDVVYEAK